MTDGSPRHFGPGRTEKRSGFTLIEILIAVGVLAIGIIGILTFFPVAIRNISVAVSRTVAASVGKSVVVSLNHYAIDLSVIDPDNLAGNPAGTISAGADTFVLDGTRDSWTDALLGFDGDVGNGDGTDSFKIPDGVTLPKVLRTSAGTTVAVPGKDEYSWSATFLPIPMDAAIDDSTIYSVQIAVWRNHELFTGLGLPTGTFENGNDEVDISGEADEFWDAAKPGNFIRHTGMGIWCQIKDRNSGADTVTLSRNFYHTSASISGSVEVASRFRLVALYDTTVGQ